MRKDEVILQSAHRDLLVPIGGVALSARKKLQSSPEHYILLRNVQPFEPNKDSEPHCTATHRAHREPCDMASTDCRTDFWHAEEEEGKRAARALLLTSSSLLPTKISTSIIESLA